MKNYRIILIILIILQIVTPVFSKSGTMEGVDGLELSKKKFFVATNGNDKWTGTLPIPNSSRNDGPFATLQQGRNAIRKLRKSGSNDIFTVIVRGGVYQLNKTLILGPEDSGITFKAFIHEHPVLRGTRKINNFKPYKGKILRADLRGISLDSDSIRQLFADGKRQVLARFPNFDPKNPVGGGFLYVDDIAEEGSKAEFKYKDGSVHDWAKPLDAEVVIYPGPNYWNNVLKISKIDKDNHLIILSQNASYAIKPGNRYYFQNLLEELDSPGEWYYDHREKVLYFWPPNMTAIKSVSVPVLKSLLEIKGDPENGSPCHIRFEGFTLEGCDGNAIVVTGAKRTVIAKCTIFNAGGQGIEVRGGFENAVVGNDIYQVGGSGISISGGDRKTLIPGKHRADNNWIYDIGVFQKASSGIECRGVGNIVSHNLINSVPRIGICFDGNDNIIEYNHVHHVNQETQDSGIIYSCARDWTKRGNVIRFNYVHDSGGYGRNTLAEAWRTPFFTWGIYLDDWSSGTKVYGNIVANTYIGGIYIHGGKDNFIENNVINEGGWAQMCYLNIPYNDIRVRRMYELIDKNSLNKYPLLSKIECNDNSSKMSGNRFVRNIVYYRRHGAMLYSLRGYFDIASNIFDNNIIYHNDSPILVPFPKVPPGLQWQKWQDKGRDQHSLLADPRFIDIVRGDYHLSPDSPALKLGFKPIPIDRIGPYKDPLRASWPIH